MFIYFPYLRGRQNELLALRELVQKNLLSPNILPVVEPVKFSPTLAKTLETFIGNKHSIALIRNPAVGDFVKDLDQADNDNKIKKSINDSLSNECIIKAGIMKKNTAQMVKGWSKQFQPCVIINTDREWLEEYCKVFSVQSPSYTLIPDKSAFRRRVSGNKILFEDRFIKRERNSNYADHPDELFSEDHLDFEEDEFNGFGDYSIIGSDYMESGFAPYAVAIHIVYFDKNDSLRIHHFVSKSNEDPQNPAKKFYEAVEQLALWVKKNPIYETEGLKALLGHHEKQTYPGLGSIKKLSLMHHLELMTRYLDGKDYK